jgi:hypothetical protein
VIPSRFAAFVKLRSSATVRNTDNELRSSVAICEFYSPRFGNFGPSQALRLALAWK